jgi:quercetin dioxygenase-like cupin family protein
MTAEHGAPSPLPRTIPLRRASGRHVLLLHGRPETTGMRSGLVTLEPGEAVRPHDTADHEELIVVLEGEGALRVAGESALAIDPATAAYCPPHRVHDVVNTGRGTLRYVYVVSAAG